MIKSKPASELKQFAVVDVRDDDFVVRVKPQQKGLSLRDKGGNIVEAVNVPSNTFHDNVQGLVKRLDEGAYQRPERSFCWLG